VGSILRPSLWTIAIWNDFWPLCELSGLFHPTSVVRSTAEPGEVISPWAADDPLQKYEFSNRNKSHFWDIYENRDSKYLRQNLFCSARSRFFDYTLDKGIQKLGAMDWGGISS
jgi:hypothetical protein